MLQTNETPEPAGWLFSKWGLQVRTGSVVEIRVAAEATGHAMVGWGSLSAPGPVARVTNCVVPACTSECAWLAFAGGYWVDAPRCVSLVVRSAAREARVSIGIGVACP